MVYILQVLDHPCTHPLPPYGGGAKIKIIKQYMSYYMGICVGVRGGLVLSPLVISLSFFSFLSLFVHL